MGIGGLTPQEELSHLGPNDLVVFGRAWEHKVPPLCPRCGYDLRGATRQLCNECGYATTFAQLREAAQDTQQALYQLKNASSILKGGIYTLVAGFVVIGLCRLSALGGMGMLIGVFCGLGAIGCGLRVYGLRRLPPQAVQLLDDQPDYTKGTFIAVLGALLIVLSLWAA